MIFCFLILAINLLRDQPIIKDEFEILDKRTKKMNFEEEDDDDNGGNFGNTINDDVSKNSDDIYSSINEQTPFADIDEIPESLPNVLEAADNKALLENLTKMLNKKLGLDDEIAGVNDEKAWEEFHKHFQENFDKYNIDGHFSIQLQIRYFLCCYIIMFIPGQFAFFYPAFWPKLIPSVVLSNEIMKSVIYNIQFFQKFVKKRSKKTLLIRFYLGRKNSVLEDLQFLLKLPLLIFSDPLAIVRELLAFEVKSEGYEKYKEKQIAKQKKKRNKRNKKKKKKKANQ